MASTSGVSQLCWSGCGGGGDDGSDSDSDFPVELNITTGEDSAKVEFQSDLNSTDHQFDPETSASTIDPVDEATEVKPGDLTKVKVYQGGELVVSLDAGLDQAYQYDAMTINVRNGTQASDCVTNTTWETHYADIDPTQDPPNPEKNVSVFVMWRKFDSDSQYDSGEIGPNTTIDNPVVLDGYHTWEDENQLDHYELNYRVEVSQETIYRSGWFEAGPSDESAC